MTYVRRYGDDFDADDGTLIENYTPPADGLGAWSRGNADSGYWKIDGAPDSVLHGTVGFAGGNLYVHAARALVDDLFEFKVQMEFVDENGVITTADGGAVVFMANDQDGASATRQYIKAAWRYASAGLYDLFVQRVHNGADQSAQDVANDVALPGIVVTGTALNGGAWFGVRKEGATVTLFSEDSAEANRVEHGSVVLSTVYDDGLHTRFGVIGGPNHQSNQRMRFYNTKLLLPNSIPAAPARLLVR